MLSRFAGGCRDLCFLARSSSGPAAAAKGITFRVKLDPKLVGAKPESGRVLVGIAKAKQRPELHQLPPAGAADPRSRRRRVRREYRRDARQRLAHVPVREAQRPAGRRIFGAGHLRDQPRHQPAERARQPLLRPGHREARPRRRHGRRPHARTRPTRSERRRTRQTAKFLKLPSKLLSDFHGRPMEYRVGVVLPPNFDKEPDKKYGLHRRHRRLRHALHRRPRG